MTGFDPSPFQHLKTDYEVGAIGGPNDAPGIQFVRYPGPPFGEGAGLEGRCGDCAMPWDDHGSHRPGGPSAWLEGGPNDRPACVGKTRDVA